MSTTDTTVEELLSQAQFSAIIAQSGTTVSRIDTDYGVDLEVRQIREINGRRVDVGPVCDVQLKATINYELKGKHVIYDMDVDAHNKLVDRNKHKASIYCLLVLCCLPKLRKDWLTVEEERLELKHCCYYKLIEGNISNNSSSIRLKIPRSQLLTPRRAIALLRHVKARGVS